MTEHLEKYKIAAQMPHTMAPINQFKKNELEKRNGADIYQNSNVIIKR